MQNIPQQRTNSELPQELTNMFKRNMKDRYIDRLYASSGGGKYPALNNFAKQNF